MKKLNKTRAFLLLGAVLVLVFALSLLVGRYPAPGFMSPFLPARDTLAARLVWGLRLPRLLAALLLGTALAASGTVFQMLFGNPLVEPGFLGVSSGAAFGACLGIITCQGQPLAVQGLSALGAFAGLSASSFIARKARLGTWTLRLVLAGLTVSALFSAALGVLKTVADPLRQLPEINFWLLGGLSGITWAQLRLTTPVVLLALALMIAMRWRLNVLALDEVTIYSLGGRPVLERQLLLIAAVAATASVVSISGMVGWVGLIIPHIARRIFGANAQHSLPASALLGGIFVMICDDLARTAFAGEIPLGVLTSFFGALIFLGILVSRSMELQE